LSEAASVQAEDEPLSEAGDEEALNSSSQLTHEVEALALAP
jgi:hypothetical protein